MEWYIGSDGAGDRMVQVRCLVGYMGWYKILFDWMNDPDMVACVLTLP
jgi:hypothetical protein